MRDGLADHWRRSLRRGTRQVNETNAIGPILQAVEKWGQMFEGIGDSAIRNRSRYRVVTLLGAFPPPWRSACGRAGEDER
jgi:hypothetical protein